METPKEIKICPFCEKETVNMIIKDFKHITRKTNKITQGKFWVYKCESCSEEFTSTESDTISQKTWKHKYL